MKKRILLTGAAGAIGHEILKKLVSLTEEHQITVLVKNSYKHRKLLRKFEDSIEVIYGDIRKKETTDIIAKDKDVVLHLAAVIPPEADFKKQLTEEVNYGGTVNIVNSLEKFSPDAFFIYSSSISVYGDRLENPWIKVGDKLQASPHDEYARTKIKAESFIQNSKLNWTIFRLTAIMHPSQKFDPLMFHMPLDTKMEICTTSDTATAFINAIEKTSQLNKRTFNLSGGKNCRVQYAEFLEKCFKISGLGNQPFPSEAYATSDFHCGYYEDSEELNEILDFQKDTINDYYEQFGNEMGQVKINLAKFFRYFIIKYFLSKSDPYKIYKS